MSSGVLRRGVVVCDAFYKILTSGMNYILREQLKNFSLPLKCTR